MLPEMAQLQQSQTGFMPQKQSHGLFEKMARNPGKTALFGGLGGLGLAGLFGTQGGKNFMFGTPGHNNQLSTQSPEGIQLLQHLLSQGMQNTDFSGIENMARKNFSEKTIPGLAERFSSMGSQGAQRSSEFAGGLGNGGQVGGALGGAGANLEAQLAALRSQYGLQQSSLGLTPQFENIYEKRTPGMMGTLAQLLPMLAAKMAMGGM